MINLLKISTCFLISFSTINAQLQFSEEAGNLGCGNTTYGNGTLGGGLAFFDFDQDGWDDLTITSEEGRELLFFKNNNGQFQLIDLGINDTLENKTAQWVDFDNDGDYDLYTTSILDDNRLYENDGNMQFTNITATAGIGIVNQWSFGSSWGDYNKDGWLDLFLTTHHEPNSGYYNILYKNNGDGTFTDVSLQAGILQDAYFAFCAAFFDYDKDGWQDIYIANDRDPDNQMYRNNGDGTFTEVGMATGTAVSIDAMSTTIDDANNDGWLDIYVTNTGAGNAFFMNNANGTFDEIAAANGTLMQSVAWGAVFLDGENKGVKDLYVSAMIDDPIQALTSAYYYNDGSGNYIIPMGVGFDNDHAVSFGNAIGDINNDGLPDIAVLNYEPNDIFLFKNVSTTTNNWLKVQLEGVISNRQGIGSWIEISVNGEKQYNYTLLGEGYLGQNSAYEFFGIGDATEIDYVKVTWLSGIVDLIENPTINSHMVIVEGSSVLGGEDESGVLNSVLLYPNPTNTLLNIEVSSEMIGANISISDVNGRRLENTMIISEQTTLEVSNFAIGVYFVRITQGDQVITKKLLID